MFGEMSMMWIIIGLLVLGGIAYYFMNMQSQQGASAYGQPQPESRFGSVGEEYLGDFSAATGLGGRRLRSYL